MTDYLTDFGCLTDYLTDQKPFILSWFQHTRNGSVSTILGIFAGSKSFEHFPSKDFMSISSHKIHGVKGVGALYVRDKQYLSPIINGGLVQEFGLRGGTENVAGIVGFGKACELAGKGIEDYSRTVISFKKHFCEILKDRLADEHMENDVSINGLLPKYPGKTLSLTFKNVDAETLVLMMSAKGVCISAGSACTSHESKSSHVLKAIGLSDDDARSTVRISFSEFNTTYEIERAAKILANCVSILRGVRV